MTQSVQNTEEQKVRAIKRIAKEIPETTNPSKKITLLDSQQRVLNSIIDFIQDDNANIFILRGYAGTGKTTLIKSVIEWLLSRKYVNAVNINAADNEKYESEEAQKPSFCALASTGRASKVLSDKIGVPTKTVHSYIYRFEGFNRSFESKVDGKQIIDEHGQLYMNFGYKFNNDHNIFIVDESSMVSDIKEENPAQATYGSGKLLSDLLRSSEYSKYIFVGDECQLPPVSNKNSSSPALDPEYLKDTFGLNVRIETLNEIVRQADDNDIISAAAKIRSLSMNPPIDQKWGKFPLRGYKNIHLVNEQITLINRYVKEIQENGYNATTLITHSNKDCNAFSQTIRGLLGFNQKTLMVGELLLVTQNNLPTNLMNGDLVRVKSIGIRQNRANLTFVNVEVQEISTGRVYNTLLIEDLIYSNSSNLEAEAQKALFIDFYKRAKERITIEDDKKLEDHSEFKKLLQQDEYLNALRAVYGYALTCHKTQGGEWDKVFLNIPSYLSCKPKKSTYQWLYTAITRAKKELYVTDGFFIEGYDRYRFANTRYPRY